MARVFLVDRDDDTRTAVRSALEDVGHTVAETADARAALALLRLMTHPVVVLVEDTNRWLDGATLIQTVAADPVLAARHVSILTTSDRAPLPEVVIDRLIGLPLPVVLKPFDLQTLVTLVAQARSSITPARFIPARFIPARSIPGAWRRMRRMRAGYPSRQALGGASKPGMGPPPR